MLGKYFHNESLRNLQLGASQIWRVWLILWVATLSLYKLYTPSTFPVYEAHNGLNTAYFGGYTTLITHNL